MFWPSPKRLGYDILVADWANKRENAADGNSKVVHMRNLQH